MREKTNSLCITTSSSCHQQHRTFFIFPSLLFFYFSELNFLCHVNAGGVESEELEKNTTRDAKSSLITMLLSWCKTWANSSENFSFFFKGKLWKMLRGNWWKAHSTSADVGSETRCESFIQSFAYIHGIFCYLNKQAQHEWVVHQRQKHTWSCAFPAHSTNNEEFSRDMVKNWK